MTLPCEGCNNSDFFDRKGVCRLCEKLTLLKAENELYKESNDFYSPKDKWYAPYEHDLTLNAFDSDDCETFLLTGCRSKEIGGKFDRETKAKIEALK